jgi:CubicO group peptidase (beta-lactamase class C family)
LRLPARDLAKFGFLYLNGGRWDDKQLIPAAYVAAATSPKGSAPNLDNGYGWHWWVDTEWNTGRLAERRDSSFVIASASNMA